MKKELPSEFYEAVAKIGQAMGVGGTVHIIQPRICDHCQDDRREAFPYGVYDASGEFWNDLCNECYDALGCRYDWTDDELENDFDPEACPWCGSEINLAGFDELECDGCGFVWLLEDDDEKGDS